MPGDLGVVCQTAKEPGAAEYLVFCALTRRVSDTMASSADSRIRRSRPMTPDFIAGEKALDGDPSYLVLTRLHTSWLWDDAIVTPEPD